MVWVVSEGMIRWVDEEGADSVDFRISKILVFQKLRRAGSYCIDRSLLKIIGRHLAENRRLLVSLLVVVDRGAAAPQPTGDVAQRFRSIDNCCQLAAVDRSEGY